MLFRSTFCENPENLHQPAVRKVLGDNLLMAMGAMLVDAQPMVTAESISHQSYRRLLSRAREYVLENMSEPVTVLDLCNQLHVSRRTLQNAFHAILGIGPNAWLKRIRLNAVRAHQHRGRHPGHAHQDRKSTRLNSSHRSLSRMPSSA